ncbi:MAG: hypothetical protein JNG85_16865 [Spirochaetaceae bacterium]|nr:hypothetical protein [Spirochaetaceae bacterium]
MKPLLKEGRPRFAAEPRRVMPRAAPGSAAPGIGLPPDRALEARLEAAAERGREAAALIGATERQRLKERGAEVRRSLREALGVDG